MALSIPRTVKFGDNSLDFALGKRNVQVISIHTISDVCYVHALKMNLLSVGQLQEKGYELNIQDGVCNICDSYLGLIAQIKISSNRLFPL